MTGVLIREETRREEGHVKTEAEMQEMHLLSQGMPRSAGNTRTQEKGMEQILPLILQRQHGPANTWDFKCLTSRTWRAYISVLSHPVYGTCYSSHRKLMQVKWRC